MIAIKNEQELILMRQACKITAAARALAGEMVRPGVTTKEIDKAVHDFIVQQGAKPSFLHYNGFPASTCISVNSTVIHGIPGGYTLQEGDIVSIDVGAYYKGFHGDCAATFPCGTISAQAQRLIDVTKQSFFEGKATGIRAEISHLKTSGRRNWGKIDQVLEKMQSAVDEGLLLGSDRYPFCAAGTDLDVVFPDWAGEGAAPAEMERLRNPELRAKIISDIDASGRNWSEV